ncbi:MULTISPECIES: AsmA-like C-terminal region-containing protein [unclassified Myroides]|uniref:AsmA-like C-terminal region-containing protein n=1 Tax=unclassified Myroides TaxID=2642485 RepID=UPI003D2F8EF1
MSFSGKKIFKRIAIAVGVLVVFVLGLLLVLPLFFKDTVNEEIKKMLADSIEGEVVFDDIEVSFYKNFPYLTATVVNPNIEGVQVDSLHPTRLLQAKELGLGINMMSLLNSKISFDRVFVDSPVVDLLVNEKGEANYMVVKSTDEEETDEKGFDLQIDRLEIKNALLRYCDEAGNLYFTAVNFDYLGSGNMSDAVFQLKSKVRIKSFDFSFDHVFYVKDKPVLADLETLIDTKSLTFEFQKNNLKIKDLLVSFIGRFGFVENGYDMLFDINTENSSLNELLSLVPPEYQTWFDNTKFTGVVDGKFKLEGQFLALDTIMPSISLDLAIANGGIQHKGVTDPIEDLTLDFHFKMPSLDMELSEVSIDTLAFDIAGRKTNFQLHTKGFEKPMIESLMDLDLDLGLIQQAVGLTGFDMKGDLKLKGKVDGQFAKGIVETRTLRKVKRDTVITSIPSFDFEGMIRNGYFKLDSLPQALKEISFDIKAEGETNQIKDIKFRVDNLNLLAMDNFVKGHFAVNNLQTYDVDARIEANIDFDNIKEFIPFDEAVLRGNLLIDGTVKGSYEPTRKRFPVMNTEVKLHKGYVQLKRLPELPIEDIEIHTIIKSARGSINDLSIEVLPINFKIANEPFQLAASLYNLNNLNYNITSKGTINIGDFYKIFKVDGIDVHGRIITSLFLKGLQSDALKGDFDKLKNGGKFEVDNIRIHSDMFPYPLHIKKGVFKFFKEKMGFEKFVATYGSSEINMKGYLTNVVDHILKEDTLRGSFTFESPSFNVDEFMMFDSKSASAKKATVSSSGTGVIQVPKNLNILFDAAAQKIKYSEYNLENFTGSLLVNAGKIELQKTDFELIGTKVNMKGIYEPTGFRKAKFDYAIQASDFDIQRAYKEITLFREMVSMAKDAHGQVSLDYKLAGDLDKNMFPVFRSLVGGGSLTLEDIEFKGFNLLGAIAKETNTKSLEEGKAKDVEIKTTIKDNVMTIERTRMKMAGFRPRFEGQVSLDGEMNIGLRLGLPPMGIIGIPMKIQGNSDNFKIKLGRYKPSEVLGKPSEHDDEEEEEEQEEGATNEAGVEHEVAPNTEATKPTEEGMKEEVNEQIAEPAA